MLNFIFLFLFIYIVIVFGLSRLIIPHLGFYTGKIPDQIPDSMASKIDELKCQASSPREFLELAYFYLGDRYRSERFNTLLKFNYLFYDLEKIWEMSGYIPCTQSSFLFRIFLIRSGFFDESEIKRRHVFANFILHQYLQVKIEGDWINVDVGEKQRGLPIGKHFNFFG